MMDQRQQLQPQQHPPLLPLEQRLSAVARSGDGLGVGVYSLVAAVLPEASSGFIAWKNAVIHNNCLPMADKQTVPDTYTGNVDGKPTIVVIFDHAPSVVRFVMNYKMIIFEELAAHIIGGGRSTTTTSVAAAGNNVDDNQASAAATTTTAANAAFLFGTRLNQQQNQTPNGDGMHLVTLLVEAAAQNPQIQSMFESYWRSLIDLQTRMDVQTSDTMTQEARARTSEAHAKATEARTKEFIMAQEMKTKVCEENCKRRIVGASSRARVALYMATEAEERHREAQANRNVMELRQQQVQQQQSPPSPVVVRRMTQAAAVEPMGYPIGPPPNRLPRQPNNNNMVQRRERMMVVVPQLQQRREMVVVEVESDSSRNSQQQQEEGAEESTISITTTVEAAGVDEHHDDVNDEEVSSSPATPLSLVTLIPQPEEEEDDVSTVPQQHQERPPRPPSQNQSAAHHHHQYSQHQQLPQQQHQQFDYNDNIAYRAAGIPDNAFPRDQTQAREWYNLAYRQQRLMRPTFSSSSTLSVSSSPPSLLPRGSVDINGQPVNPALCCPPFRQPVVPIVAAAPQVVVHYRRPPPR